VQDVRAVAPRPAPDARARLDARAGAGFEVHDTSRRIPTARRLRLASGRLPRPRVLMPAAGIAAAALVALTVALGVHDGAPDQSVTGGRAAGTGPATELAPPDSVAGGDSGPATKPAPSDQATGIPGAATPSPPAANAAPGVAAPAPAAGRRIERSVRLELGARAGRFGAVTDAVVRATQRAGGYVASSGVARDGSRGTASFVLRIPVARLDGAIADLSRLAHVRAIEQATQDLTGAYDGASGRLRDARAQRRALVAAVATATGDEAARLRARLATATARVTRLERAVRALRARTAYATVDLAVIEARRSAGAGSGSDGRWTPADAWHDARRGLELAAGLLIIVLALGLPIALAGSLAAVAAGAVRRRRRDAALDAA
jgi:hypothetical protein